MSIGLWTVTAPGKVVLLGEYAVLDGAPAVAMAINRRCRVRLEPAPPGGGRIEARPLAMPPARFSLRSGGRMRWRAGPAPAFAPTASLIESLVADIHARGGQVHPFSMTIDTSELFEGGLKLGLGSSAASAVAIDAALRAAFPGRAAAERAVDTVARLRAAQGGAGSGIDLAASVCGGLIGYRIAGEHISIQPLRLPAALVPAFVWVGRPASTAELLAAWQRARQAAADDHARLLDAMKAVAARGLEALMAGHSAGFQASLADYGQIMGKMNVLLGRDVMTAEHHRAAALARRLGGAYKPCGAGGGDVGMAATAATPDFEARVWQAWRQAGLQPLALRPEPQGVHIMRE